MADDLHSCSYFCERPECIKAQRDELRDRMVLSPPAKPLAMSEDDTVSWIRWFLSNVLDPEDFRWVKMREAADKLEQMTIRVAELEQREKSVREFERAVQEWITEGTSIIDSASPSLLFRLGVWWADRPWRKE